MRPGAGSIPIRAGWQQYDERPENLHRRQLGARGIQLADRPRRFCLARTSCNMADLTPPATKYPDFDTLSRSLSAGIAVKRSFLDNLFYMQGKFPALATANDYYMALAYAVRDRMLQRWISTAATYTKQGSRTVAYLSAEFLMGPHLGNNLINLGIYDTARQAHGRAGAGSR
jgi:hypothetical protein